MVLAITHTFWTLIETMMQRQSDADVFKVLCSRSLLSQA